jgi:plasmid stabilization system protein ParE
MRIVVYSVTARDQLRDLLAQGVPRFGPQVVAQKRDRVFAFIDGFLARHPATKRPNPELGLVVYPITGTPFAVLYDFDDATLRIHFFIHVRAAVRDIDPASVEW